MFLCSKNSFCFMRLPTAGIVIGWVTGAISLILSTLSILFLVMINKNPPNVDTPQAMLGQVLATGFSMLVGVYLAVNVLDFVASVLLIIGVKRDSHLMLLPWLIDNAFLVLLKLFSIPLSMVQRTREDDVWMSVILLGICVLQTWSWIGIWLLFRSIRASKNQQNDNKVQQPGPINYEIFYNSEGNTDKSEVKANIG